MVVAATIVVVKGGETRDSLMVFYSSSSFASVVTSIHVHHLSVSNAIAFFFCDDFRTICQCSLVLEDDDDVMERDRLMLQSSSDLLLEKADVSTSSFDYTSTFLEIL